MIGWVWRDLSDVRPGDYIADPQGQTQKVLSRDSMGILLIGSAGQSSRAPLAGPVMVWDGPMQEAINVIAATLGGAVIHDTTRRQA